LALGVGCAVGPDFAAPTAPKEAGYTPETLAPRTNGAPSKLAGGAVQTFIGDQDVSGQWWSLYHSQALNTLIDAALRASPTLDAAKAALRQAQENTSAARGAFFPDITGNVSATREKISTAGFGFPGGSSLFSVSTASVDVSYPLDVFGGVRRQVEASEATEDYQRFQLVAAYLTLTSNIVTTAVAEASLRAQIKAPARHHRYRTARGRCAASAIVIGRGRRRRGSGARGDPGAGKGDLAAAGKATGAVAQPPGGAGRPFPQRRRGRDIRA